MRLRLLLAIILPFLGLGCARDDRQAPLPAPASASAPAAPAPAPLPAPAVDKPAPSLWVARLSAVASPGLSVRFVPTPSHERGGARVYWTSQVPVAGIFAGLDRDRAMLVVDHRSPGRVAGEVDALRTDLERVVRWEIVAAKSWIDQ